MRLVLSTSSDVIQCSPAISLTAGSVSSIREALAASSVRLEKKQC
jgi:hypothetical protein